MTDFVKTPDAVTLHGFNWATWLGTDTIASSSWAVEDTGDITIDSHSNDTTTTAVWLTGGTLGTRYEVTNTIVTAAGATEERTLKVSMKDRKYT